MGRPRRVEQPVVYSLKLVLYPGADDDLLAYLRAAPARKRAAAVKAAMRGGDLGWSDLDLVPSDAEMRDALGAFLA